MTIASLDTCIALASKAAMVETAPVLSIHSNKTVITQLSKELITFVIHSKHDVRPFLLRGLVQLIYLPRHYGMVKVKIQAKDMHLLFSDSQMVVGSFSTRSRKNATCSHLTVWN